MWFAHPANGNFFPSGFLSEKLLMDLSSHKITLEKGGGLLHDGAESVVPNVLFICSPCENFLKGGILNVSF